MRIGIVHHSETMIQILTGVVNATGHLRLEWVARSGAEALARCAAGKPDIVLMDPALPGGEGLVTIRRIMERTPCPILLVTTSVAGNRDLVYEAMGLGAIDVVVVTASGADGGVGMNAEVARKIEQIGLLTGVGKVVKAPAAAAEGASRQPKQPPLVAIGASTGGPKAVERLISSFPSTVPAAIVVVQHIDRRFAAGLADWLGRSAQLPVLLARPGDRPQRSAIFLAASDDHLCLDTAGAFAYVKEPLSVPYRPSVDVFFSCVARQWKSAVAAVLLTGMGSDGARGLLELRRAGHLTIAQDEATSVVYGMPRAAATISAADRILPIERIGEAVLSYLTLRGSR